MEIRGNDCVSSYNPTEFDNTIVTAATAEIQGATTFNAVAVIDPTTDFEGNIAFCVRTDLQHSSGEIMVTRSEKVRVTLDYNAAFVVTGFATTPFVAINSVENTGTKTFGVTAVVCDSNGSTITNPSALNLGTNLFICIKTSVPGTKVKSINSFTAEKGTEVYDLKAAATRSNANVVIRGLDSSDVKVVINFPLRFFTNSNVITLSGSVAVGHNRRLVSTRALEEEIFADFDLLIDIKANDGKVYDVNGDHSSTSVSAMVMSTIIYGIVTLLLFV